MKFGIRKMKKGLRGNGYPIIPEPYPSPPFDSIIESNIRRVGHNLVVLTSPPMAVIFAIAGRVVGEKQRPDSSARRPMRLG